MGVQTVELPLVLPEGEECERCTSRLQSELERLRGVASAHVTPGGAVRISYDPDTLTLVRVESEARRIGAGIGRDIAHQSLELEGLDCPDCAATMEKSVAHLPGVIWARANFAAGRLHVEYERARVSLDAICRVAAEHGVVACPVVSPSQAGTETGPGVRRAARSPSRSRALLTAGSVALTLAALAVATRSGAAASVLYAAAIALSGWSTARAAWRSLRQRSVDMTVLMTVAVIGAMAVGEWFEAATVVVLFNVGNLLQSYAVERTRRSLRALMDLSPASARTVRDRVEKNVPVEQVAIGEIVRVRPGERIPMDGAVTAGSSSVNQAPVTGESLPADKGPGDTVYAGTLNVQGSLDIRTTRLFQDTTLARIVAGVEEAQAQRAPAQQFVDSFARVYTPIVVGLAALVAVVPPAVMMVWAPSSAGAPVLAVWNMWFMRGLALLLIACPCALVISTPVAVVAAIGTASRRGALIKGGAYLDELARVRAVLYDKTGTLTLGRFGVTEVTPLRTGASREDVMRVAAALESRSEHPLAAAFAAEAAEAGLEPLPVPEHFEALAGRGVRGDVDGRAYLLGGQSLMRAEGVVLDGARAPVEAAEARGCTAVVLADAFGPVGVFALADIPRPDAGAAVRALAGLGLQSQAMLTGDNAAVAERVADHMGIREYRAGLLPDEKLAIVREYRRRYGVVAMVGDGVNDAPAMAAANVGIAMGACGSDTAIETADVALMSDDLSRLPWLVGLGRSTRSVIAQNIGFSLATKALLMTAALTVGLPLWLAVVGDVGVSLLVTVNALRLTQHA